MPPKSTVSLCSDDILIGPMIDGVRRPLVGGVSAPIYRESDKECIGLISWPVHYKPVAKITLNDGWCGHESCEALFLYSTPSSERDWTLFFCDETPDETVLTIEPGPDGMWQAPVTLVSKQGSTIARLGRLPKTEDEDPQ
ncbi:MAG: hypothetical protein AAGE89_09790 [Pseudomonadota bacterium]